MIVGIIGYGGGLSKEMKEAILKATETMWGETKMEKFYWEVTAMTPHCGEELTEYCVTETDEKPYAFGDALMEDCIAEWFCADEYEMYGYDDAEEYEESYYEGCYCEFRRITKEDYEKYTAAYYRPM